MMERIDGIGVETFPFVGLEKVYDLLEFDGPILSHIKSGEDELLFYWIDHDMQFNRWLVWKSSFDDIYSYVYKDIDFRTLFLTADNYFTVDIDNGLNYQNTRLFLKNSLPEKYIPEEGVLFSNEVPGIYVDIASSRSPGRQLPRLRKTAFCFKLIYKNIQGAPVSAEEGGRFLTALDRSIREYAVHDYFTKYKDQISDVDVFTKKTIPLLQQATRPLVVDQQYGSFEVFINIESLQLADETPEIADWKTHLISDYYRDLFEVDYNSPSGQQAIKNKFPDAAIRTRIVRPIASFLRNTDCKLTSRKVGYSNLKINGRLSAKSYKNFGFSKRDANEEEPTIEKKYIAMILELEVENGNIIVNKQSVDKGLLFQQELEFVTLSVNEAKNTGYKVVFKAPIDYSIRKLDDGRYMARSDSPLLEMIEDTTQEAKENYLDALINWAIRIESSTNKQDRELFDQLIESIEVV